MGCILLCIIEHRIVVRQMSIDWLPQTSPIWKMPFVDIDFANGCIGREQHHTAVYCKLPRAAGFLRWEMYMTKWGRGLLPSICVERLSYLWGHGPLLCLHFQGKEWQSSVLMSTAYCVQWKQCYLLPSFMILTLVLLSHFVGGWVLKEGDIVHKFICALARVLG